jgi:hypothetical protein
MDRAIGKGMLRAALAAVAATVASAASFGAETTEVLAPGIVYKLKTTIAPLRVHVLRLDLETASVRISTAIAQDTVMFAAPERTSSMAQRRGAFAAVNADYFGANHHNCEELLYTDGRLIYAPPSPFRSILNVARDNEVHIGMDRTGLRFFNTVGGGPQLIRNGRFVWDTSVSGAINGEGFSPNTKFDGRSPSTAAGVSRDGRTLILLVADGRQPGFSVGTTPQELSDLLLAEGAYQAMRLDGGGSTTMWVGSKGGVVNSPSDGIERAVGTALLVFSDRDEPFIRGDSNGDGSVNIADTVHTLLWLFVGGPEPSCPDAADFNDSESVSVQDAIRGLQYLFELGPAPASPFPACGRDPSGGGLDCGPNTACDGPVGDVDIPNRGRTLQV